MLLVVLACSTVIAACVGDDRPVVTVERVRAGEVTQTVSAPARVDAAARQEVAAAVPGVVVAIEAEDGGRVEAGQTVVRLSSAQVEAAQRQAEAASAGASSGGRIAIDGGGRRTRKATRDAVAALDAATRPVLADARAKAQQIGAIHDRLAALAAVDAAERAYQQARIAMLSSGEAVAGQQEALAASVSEALGQAVAQAAAPARAQAAAAAAAAEAQAAQLVLLAPFAGTVQLGRLGSGGGPLPTGVELPSELAGLAPPLTPSRGGDGGPLRVGSAVSPGQTLFTVYDLSTLYVTAEVDEVDAPQIRLGQPANVLVDAIPDGSFLGIVERIAVEAATTQAGGTGYPVRIRILGPAPASRGEESPDLGALRVGMTGSVEVTTKTQDSDLVVGSRALLRRGDDTVVYVVRDGVARQVIVEVEALGEDAAAVTGALRRDDHVVVSGYEDLRDGDRVTVR